MIVSFLLFQLIKDENLLKGKLCLRSYCLSKVDRILFKKKKKKVDRIIEYEYGW